MSVVLTPGVRRGLAVHTLLRTARPEGGEEIVPPKPRPMLRASRGRLALKANVGLPCDNEREAKSDDV